MRDQFNREVFPEATIASWFQSLVAMFGMDGIRQMNEENGWVTPLDDHALMLLSACQRVIDKQHESGSRVKDILKVFVEVINEKMDDLEVTHGELYVVLCTILQQVYGESVTEVRDTWDNYANNNGSVTDLPINLN
jgi:hypothetical protein